MAEGWMSVVSKHIGTSFQGPQIGFHSITASVSRLLLTSQPPEVPPEAGDPEASPL